MKKSVLRTYGAGVLLCASLLMGACSHAESAADSSAVRSSSLQESSSTSLSSNAPVNETVTFTMHVMHQDGTGKQIQLTTNASNLADALLEQGWIAGEQSQYGLFVTEVDGEKAENGAWWKLQINGEDAQTGVSSVQPGNDAVYTWSYEQ